MPAQGVARHLFQYRITKRNWQPQLECSGYSVTDYIPEYRCQVWSRRNQNLRPLGEISAFTCLNSIPVCHKQRSYTRTNFLKSWQIKVRDPGTASRGSSFAARASWAPNRGCSLAQIKSFNKILQSNVERTISRHCPPFKCTQGETANDILPHGSSQTGIPELPRFSNCY